MKLTDLIYRLSNLLASLPIDADVVVDGINFPAIGEFFAANVIDVESNGHEAVIVVEAA